MFVIGVLVVSYLVCELEVFVKIWSPKHKWSGLHVAPVYGRPFKDQIRS